MKINKAVIAVAGYGTRFLPATKNQPKEMLPIVDKPIIQYLVEEAVASGIENIILVTRLGQATLENHFDSHSELENMLRDKGKTELLEKVQKIYKMANYIYVRQKHHLPYGNGTPLLCIKDLIEKDESFVYMFGDDMVKSEIPCTKQLIDYWKEKPANSVAVAVQEVPASEVNRYGIYKLKAGSTDQVENAVEKPSIENAPKPHLAQFGRFILNHQIIDILDKNYKNDALGKDKELWLIDAIVEYAKNNPVFAKIIDGKWMTTGDPLRFMQTAVEYAIDRSDIGPDFRKYLKSLDL